MIIEKKRPILHDVTNTAPQQINEPHSTLPLSKTLIVDEGKQHETQQSEKRGGGRFQSKHGVKLHSSIANNLKVRKKLGDSHISKDALEIIKVSFGDISSKNEAVKGMNVSFVGAVEGVAVPSNFGTPE